MKGFMSRYNIIEYDVLCQYMRYYVMSYVNKILHYIVYINIRHYIISYILT